MFDVFLEALSLRDYPRLSHGYVTNPIDLCGMQLFTHAWISMAVYPNTTEVKSWKSDYIP